MVVVPLSVPARQQVSCGAGTDARPGYDYEYTVRTVHVYVQVYVRTYDRDITIEDVRTYVRMYVHVYVLVLDSLNRTQADIHACTARRYTCTTYLPIRCTYVVHVSKTTRIQAFRCSGATGKHMSVVSIRGKHGSSSRSVERIFTTILASM